MTSLSHVFKRHKCRMHEVRIHSCSPRHYPARETVLSCNHMLILNERQPGHAIKFKIHATMYLAAHLKQSCGCILQGHRLPGHRRRRLSPSECKRESQDHLCARVSGTHISGSWIFLVSRLGCFPQPSMTLAQKRWNMYVTRRCTRLSIKLGL